jgi:3-methyladenine DNA glycosylase AlkD
MRASDVMRELESCGSEQTRRTYQRHGVAPPLFGVKYGDLDRIAKRVGRDHELAQELWASGNHDARVLACKIDDPPQVTVSQANAWARACENSVLTEAVAGVVADAPIAKDRSANWRDRHGEWIATAGWALVAICVARLGVFSDSECRALLRQIGKELPTRPNRVRYEMNMALIAIGLRGGALEDEALRVARKLGPVEVDHGQTSCVTPDAQEYIARAKQKQRTQKNRVGARR